MLCPSASSSVTSCFLEAQWCGIGLTRISCFISRSLEAAITVSIGLTTVTLRYANVVRLQWLRFHWQKQSP